jgi:hypothetical protein
MTASSSRRHRAALLFVLAFAVYNANLRYTASYDSFATSLIPFRLLTGHGLTLSAADAVPSVAYSIVRSKTGSFVSFYPVVTALLVTPLYVPAVLWPWGADPEVARVLMEKIAASVLAAASVAFVFLALRRLASERAATLLAFAYAFGTLTWAVSSQALWLQTSSGLLVALALFLLASGLGTPAACAGLGLVCGLLAANRPTDGIFALTFALLAWRANRRGFPLFAGAAAAVGSAAVGWNLVHFGHALGGYGIVFFSGGNLARGSSVTGVLGLLFSNRGLLATSPFLLALALHRPSRARLPGTTLLLAAYAASLWIHAGPADWWGGYTFGARYTLHGLPILFVALAEPAERLCRHAAGIAFLTAAGLVAATVEIAGAFFYPAGDSGNAGQGLWSPAKAPAIAALAAGPRPPDFLGMIVPRLAMSPAPLTARDAAARYAWRDEPNARWAPNERRRLRLDVENLGRLSWKSLGGFMNRGGVRLSVRWIRAGDGGAPIPEETHWVAFRLRAGRAVTLPIEIQAPPDEGGFTLRVELTQLGIGQFSEEGIPPLTRDITVVRPEDGLTWEISVPAEMDPNLPGRAWVRIAGAESTRALAWRWRRPGGPVIRTDGPVTLASSADGRRIADLSLPTRIVAGEYVLEFGLVDFHRPQAFERVSPSRRIALTGSWAPTIREGDP